MSQPELPVTPENPHPLRLLGELPKELGLVETAEMIEARKKWIQAVSDTSRNPRSNYSELETQEDSYYVLVGALRDLQPTNALIDVGWQIQSAYINWVGIEDLWNPNNYYNTALVGDEHRVQNWNVLRHCLEVVLDQAENLAQSPAIQSTPTQKDLCEKAIRIIQEAITYLEGLSFLPPEPNQDSK